MTIWICILILCECTKWRITCYEAQIWTWTPDTT